MHTRMHARAPLTPRTRCHACSPAASRSHSPPPAPLQASGLGRYIKKKTLDPLETYVPLVLQAQEQLLALKGTLGEQRW